MNFEWLSKIFDFFIQTVPVRWIIDPTQVVIAMPLGRPRLCTDKSGVFGTGIHIHWPLISGEASWLPVTEQSPETAEQKLHTADGVPVAVKPDYSYLIADPVRVATAFPDYEDLAAMRLLAATADGVTETAFEDLSDAEEVIKEHLNESLAEIGLKLCWFTLGSRQRGLALFIWGADNAS